MRGGIRNRTLLALPLALALTSCGGTPAQPSPPPLTRIISITGNLSFGNVTIGNSGASTMTISNSGTGPLTVTSLSGPAVYTTNWTSGVIPAGGSVLMNIGFTPTAAQSYNSTIVVNGDQTAGNNVINVSGTGVALCQANNTALLTFGNRSTSNRTYDVLLNGARVATITPGADSQTFTVAAGVTQAISFLVTNTSAQACNTSFPVLAQCASQIFTCGF